MASSTVFEEVSSIRNQLKAVVQTAHSAGKLTSEAVLSLATLILQDDEGNPLRHYAHTKLMVELMCNPTIKNLILIFPPGTGKSMTLIAYMVAYLAFNPSHSIILSSVSATVAERRSLTVRGILNSDEFAEVFPEIHTIQSGDMKFTGSSWSVYSGKKQPTGRIHPSFSSYGIGGSIIGSRAHLLVSDDILDWDSTRSQTQMENNYSWIFNSFLSRRLPRAKTIIVGNAWTVDDPYHRLIATKDFVVVKIPLVIENPPFEIFIDWPENFHGKVIGEVVNEN